MDELGPPFLSTPPPSLYFCWPLARHASILLFSEHAFGGREVEGGTKRENGLGGLIYCGGWGRNVPGREQRSAIGLGIQLLGKKKWQVHHSVYVGLWGSGKRKMRTA